MMVGWQPSQTVDAPAALGPMLLHASKTHARSLLSFLSMFFFHVILSSFALGTRRVGRPFVSLM